MSWKTSELRGVPTARKPRATRSTQCTTGESRGLLATRKPRATRSTQCTTGESRGLLTTRKPRVARSTRETGVSQSLLTTRNPRAARGRCAAYLRSFPAVTRSDSGHAATTGFTPSGRSPRERLAPVEAKPRRSETSGLASLTGDSVAGSCEGASLPLNSAPPDIVCQAEREHVWVRAGVRPLASPADSSLRRLRSESLARARSVASSLALTRAQSRTRGSDDSSNAVRSTRTNANGGPHRTDVGAFSQSITRGVG